MWNFQFVDSWFFEVAWVRLSWVSKVFQKACFCLKTTWLSRSNVCWQVFSPGAEMSQYSVMALQWYKEQSHKQSSLLTCHTAKKNENLCKSWTDTKFTSNFSQASQSYFWSIQLQKYVTIGLGWEAKIHLPLPQQTADFQSQDSVDHNHCAGAALSAQLH